MANPVTVKCLAGIYKKIATGVIGGEYHKLDTKPNLYLMNYRMTGDPPPTLREEGVPVFIGKDSEDIDAAAAVDYYIMAIGADGKIRVDLP